MKRISFLVTNYSLRKSSGGLSPGGLSCRKRFGCSLSFLGAPKAGFIPLRGFSLRLSIARAFVVSLLSQKKSLSDNVLH